MCLTFETGFPQHCKDYMLVFVQGKGKGDTFTCPVIPRQARLVMVVIALHHHSSSIVVRSLRQQDSQVSLSQERSTVATEGCNGCYRSSLCIRSIVLNGLPQNALRTAFKDHAYYYVVLTNTHYIFQCSRTFKLDLIFFLSATLKIPFFPFFCV